MVLPVIVLLLVMALDFGRVFFGWVALQNASRIAANFAAMHADDWSVRQADYRALVRGDMESINCFPPDGSWDDTDVPDPTYPSGTGAGMPAVVALTCSFGLITPLAESVLGGPVTLHADSTFAIYKAIQQPLPPAVEPEPPDPDPDPDPGPDPDTCATPAADFSFAPNPARKNQAVSFTDTSAIGTCTALAWSWDFDHEDATSSVQNPSYTYTWNGNSNKTYDVTLTITTTGGVDSVTRSVPAQP